MIGKSIRERERERDYRAKESTLGFTLDDRMIK